MFLFFKKILIWLNQIRTNSYQIALMFWVGMSSHHLLNNSSVCGWALEYLIISFDAINAIFRAVLLFMALYHRYCAQHNLPHLTDPVKAELDLSVMSSCRIQPHSYDSIVKIRQTTFLIRSANDRKSLGANFCWDITILKPYQLKYCCAQVMLIFSVKKQDVREQKRVGKL